ncbi:MAG: hypothetical protein QOJ80_4052 [Mycobacterium sp.]|nr:hypothetical protein [Mycobacterium sp.]
MRTTIKYRAWLVTVSIGAAIALAPIASADTDPQVPYSPDPYVPYGPQLPQSPDVFGQHPSNHDETDTTNGYVDLPF